MPLSSGDQLGHYKIQSMIGKGGMGEVYRAVDTKLERDVAIKVLPASFASDSERLARFEREAKVLASLNHPNIASIYGVADRALVMELVPGPTLEDRIKQGPVPEAELRAILLQIAEALEYAHDKGIIHRDLKPANIKIDPEDRVKILDFGLAKALDDPSAGASGNLTDSPTITMGGTIAGTILGTAAYMAPEQARGKKVDRRADIWAFGVVVWEMLTGERLFQGDDTVQVLSRVLEQKPDLERVPEKFRKLLGRCLNRNVKDRLRDIGEARFLLEDVKSGAEAPLRSATRATSGLPWVFAAGILALGLGALAVVHFREPSAPLVKLQFPPPEKAALLLTTGPPAVSPDGRRIAFVGTSNGKRMLWVRDLDTLESRALPGTDGGRIPFWAPDGRLIGFDQQGKLMKIDISGGGPISVAASNGTRGGAWTQDNTIVFMATGGVLMRVPAGGGTPVPLTELDQSRDEIAHRWPHFLPDGRHFLYSAISKDAEKSAIFAGDLQSKEKKLVVAEASSVQYVEPGFVLFGREHTLFTQPFDAGKLQTTGDAVPVAEQVYYNSTGQFAFFGASRNGVLAYASGAFADTLQITWYDRSGKAVGTVGKPADIQTPRLSPDGKTVATDRLDSTSGNRDIWLLDLVRGTEQRLTFAGINHFPVWSPDGKRVAYARTTSNVIATKAADGSGAEEELEAAQRTPMDWTRDGRFLISATAGSAAKTGNDLWALPLASGKPGGKPFPLRNSEFGEWHGRVSPDGKWLAYESDESKRKEVYVVGFPGLNGRWQVSVNGGRYPLWSRDGRELYFVGLDDKLMAVAVKSGEQFQTGLPQPLFDVRLGTSNPSYDVSADGRFLIATPVERSASMSMTVVLNWQAMLKK